MATVSLDCRSRTDQDGLAAVRLRVEHQGTQKFINTGVKVKPGKWRKGKVTRGHREADRINSRLREVESAAQDALTKLRASAVPITVERLKARVQDELDGDEAPAEQPDFISWSLERVQKVYDNQGTRRNHRSSLKKFERFLGEQYSRADIGFRELNASLLEEMMAWESTELGNANSTVHKTMRTLRRMCNLAIRDGHMQQSEYPFQHITLSRSRTQKQPLTDGEVEALEERRKAMDQGLVSYPRRDTTAAHALRSWLVQMYLLGMRWGDVCSLEWDNLRDGRVQYQMLKTGTAKSVKLVPKARAIIEVYADRQGEKRFVFPFLDYRTEDLSTDEGIRQATQRVNASVNQKLRKIAERVGITSTLTTHIARHTAANRMASAGWELRKISAALGHQSVSTTEQYLRSLKDDELDEDHADLF
ncbi:tyrosine-type recombinase/integrase [Salinibacter ruber]|uniref:tyrosine-type recombinase/integrase n=1 Tax=Salinibacter ruber TaxID=146919 RepID=UPI002169E45C|nr:integrase [Salinibacter ruber]